MPVLHDKERLNKLLLENGVSISDAVARSRFYAEHFDWDSLSEEYTQGSSIRDLCKETGLSYDTVRINLIRKLGSLRKFSVKGSSKFTFYTSHFVPYVDEIGSYFLGWMYSDGCVTDNKITITLKGNDFDHLSYLSSLVSDKPVRFNTKKNVATFDYYGVDLCRMFQLDLGVHKRKSFSDYLIPIQMFSDSCVPYLLLGLLEGDGSIAKSSLSCQLLLTSNTWNSLSVYLNKIVDLTKVTTVQLNDYGLLCVNFRGVSYFSLLSYIYLNTRKVKPLPRKFQRFLNQLDRSSNGRTSPYKKLAVNIRDSLSNTDLI